MFSRDGSKHWIIGIAKGIVLEGDQCEPNITAIFVPVNEHLDWIRILVGDEMCITKRLRLGSERVVSYLQVVALCIIAIALSGYIIASGRKPN